jgi:long-chain-fatty-acid--[acyl-carrier-protein] ligase
MKIFILRIVACCVRAVFSLRYRVKIKGLKDIKNNPSLKEGKILFLPNHAAVIDPMVIMAYLWPIFKMRPLIVDYAFENSLVRKFLFSVGSLSMPNFETSLTSNKVEKAKEVFKQIQSGLDHHDNFLIYPSGRVKNSGKEIIAGSSGVHRILSECPDANIVLIRSTGFWGSTFSKAYSKKTPDFFKTLAQDFKYLIGNLIFFMPRREILIEIEERNAFIPRHGTRLELNQALEKWYNQYFFKEKIYTEEPLRRVSYYFWKRYFLKPLGTGLKKPSDKITFSSKIEEDIYQELYKKLGDVEIAPNLNLFTDLGLDSLDLAELYSFLNTHYFVEESAMQNVETVQDLIELAENKKIAPPEEKIKKSKSSHQWPQEAKRMNTELPTGKTIPEAFLRICDRMGDDYAVGDDIVGPLTYKKLKLLVLALAQEIKKLPGDKVGIMMPASAVSYMLLLACELSKKLPVMLNWTLGPRYLDQTIHLTNLKTVITSKAFIEKVGNKDFGILTQYLLFVEDIKKKLTLPQKLKAAFLSKYGSRALLKMLGLESVKENDPAVLLFTSGTESMPKAVPLSHKNLLFNQRASMQCVEMKPDDVMLGILPPFHSFGFSVAGLFPILAGIRIVYSPDPTACRTLVDVIERWKATIVCAAPAFLKGILHTAKEHELDTVRLFVTGAEKTPNELYEKVAALQTGAKIVEGYGITECAPILSINRVFRPTSGVGQPIPGVEFITVHPETLELLPQGKEGEFCVFGDNVFEGYWYAEENNIKSPFLFINGKKWYRTGDLGHIDSNGNVIISGRLKRFAKIGGEMISLGGIESVLISELKIDTTNGVPLAAISKEEPGKKAFLVLFTTLPLEKDVVNDVLKKAGFSSLVKIQEVRLIDKIPLLGTGKTNYRYLQNLL